MNHRPSGALRLRRRVLGALTALAALAFAGAAQAAISGTVTNGAGIPLPGVSVEATDAAGSFAGFDTTDANGNYSFQPSASRPAPFSVEASKSDPCDETGTSSRVGTLGGVPDGAVGLNFILDVKNFCAGFKTSDGPEPSGLIDAGAATIRLFPRESAYLNLSGILGFSTANVVVTLADGTPIGGEPSSTNLRVIAPAADYNGPILVSFDVDGQRLTRTLGTLTSQEVRVTPLPGPIDIQAIVDLSGSMSGTDPTFIRRDALNLLIDLAARGDRVGAVGFESTFRPIFNSTVVTGALAQRNRLKARVQRRVANFGGTNYNIGMDRALQALTGPGVEPNRQKAIIFLTDGEHGGEYLNGHLRFAFNPSGRPWPVCAVQLGNPRSFTATGVARLRRIARETGGIYLQTRNASQLNDLYFRCFGRSSGRQQTVKRQVQTFAAGQERLVAQLLRGRNRSATFFSSWGCGTYQLELRDPRGVVHTRRRPGRGFTFRGGRNFAFFRVNNPRAGRWRLELKAVRLCPGVRRDRATTTITIPPRR